MKKFEYLLVNYTEALLWGFKDFLNNKGQEGWEYVGERGDVIIFKREINIQ